MTKLLIDKAVVEQALTALMYMHTEKVEYMLRNNLGNPFREDAARLALPAIDALQSALSAAAEPVKDAPAREWVERWYGSGQERGWWIVCGRDHIAHLGTDVLGDGDTVRKIVDAHNRATAKPAPQAEHPVVVPQIRPVALVVEQLDQNGARIRWMFNPVPEGEVLQWDHNGMLSASPGPAPAVQSGPTQNDKLREMLAFLHGEGPLNGAYFGERHPTERGLYWWRKHLSALTALRVSSVPDAANPETQGERKELARRLRLVAPKMEEFGNRGWAELCEQAAALLSAGPTPRGPTQDWLAERLAVADDGNVGAGPEKPETRRVLWMGFEMVIDPNMLPD